MPFPADEIERERLRQIFKNLRIVGGNIVPVPYRSDLDALTAAGVDPAGFQVDQASEYHARAAAEVCTRCGQYPPRIDRKTCARCADEQAGHMRRTNRPKKHHDRRYYKCKRCGSRARLDRKTTPNLKLLLCQKCRRADPAWCKSCGAERPIDGKKNCQRCLDAQAAATRRYKAKMKTARLAVE